MVLLLPFRSQKKWRKMLVCSSAKHRKVWGTLFSIFSILWMPLTRLFSALIFRSSSHHTSATSAPSEFPGGARSPDVGAALPPQRGSLRRQRAQARWGFPLRRQRAQARRGFLRAQVLPAGVRRRLNVCVAVAECFFQTERAFAFRLMTEASISPSPHRKSRRLPKGFVGLQAPRPRR